MASVTMFIIRPEAVMLEPHQIEYRITDDLPDFHRDIRPHVLEALAPAKDYERVNVFWFNRYTDMFVDEIGVLKGLPINVLATEIYLNNLRVHAPELLEREGHAFIHGPAVLFEHAVYL